MFLLVTVGGVALAGSVKFFRPTALDGLFLTFMACVVASFALNPLVADVRELVLAVITASAYVAGRMLTQDYLPFVRRACLRLSAFIVAMGTLITVPILISDWYTLGRPFIFGFGNATSAFSASLGIFVIALMTSQPERLSVMNKLFIALILIATAVFAASMVRFTLIAILGVLTLSFALFNRERKFTLLLLGLIVVSATLGWSVRSDNAQLYTSYMLEGIPRNAVSTKLNSLLGSKLIEPSYEAERNPQAVTPKCESVNTRNSVAIRMQLYSDAAYLVPQAGLAGFGLMAFGRLGCFKDMSPHNNVLQAIIEFGWAGGAAFLVLMLLPPLLLLKPARANADVRFLFLICVYFIMLGMIYGVMSREILLLMALGSAVNVWSTSHRPAQELRGKSRRDSSQDRVLAAAVSQCVSTPCDTVNIGTINTGAGNEQAL